MIIVWIAIVIAVTIAGAIAATVYIRRREISSAKPNLELIADLEEELGVGREIRQLPEWSWKVTERSSSFLITLFDNDNKKVRSKIVDKGVEWFSSDPYDYKRHYRKYTESELDKLFQKTMKAMVKEVLDEKAEEKMYARLANKYTTPEERPQDTLEVVGE